jgi:hypothetical protein
MNTRKLLSVASALIFLGGFMPAMDAAAQRGSRAATAGRPSVRAPQSSPSRSISDASHRVNDNRGASRFSSPPGRGNTSGSHSYRPGTGGLGSGALLNELVNRGGGGLYGNNGYRGRDYYNYRAAEAQADAYRDAALANAAVGLVGVLVNAAVQEQALRTQPVAACPVVTQPTGHYETRRSLVREGYYETRQVWVPEQVDPHTGEIILGHHETRRLWVPPVYEESQVFVPAPVTVVRPAPVVYTPVPVMSPLPPPLPMGTNVLHVQY